MAVNRGTFVQITQLLSYSPTLTIDMLYGAARLSGGGKDYSSCLTITIKNSS